MIREHIDYCLARELQKVERENIRNFLKNHERLPLLKKNLEREIFHLERHRGISLDLLQINMLVKDFFNVFAKAALQKRADEIRASENHGLKIESNDADARIEALYKEESDLQSNQDV